MITPHAQPYRLQYRIVFLILFIVTLLPAVQANDSLTLVNASWRIKKLGKGIRLYTYTFGKGELFGARENISFVETRAGLFRPKFRMAASPQKLIKTSEFARDKDAIAAINGNFFDVQHGGAVDFIKIDGAVINKNQFSGTAASRNFHQKAAVVIHKNKPVIVKWDGFENWEEWMKQPSIMVNGPLLLLNGAQEPLSDTVSFNKTRHPRTCLGIKPNGRVIMLVVDGRNENSAGMTLFELARVMQWLGCSSAINFDGGGSSTIWTRKTGIVNYPSDNKNWNKLGERKVANVLYVR